MIVFLVTSFAVVLCFGNVVHADEITSDSNDVVLGESNFNVVVTQDDVFLGLDTFVDFYSSDLDDVTKSLLTKELTSLVLSVFTDDASYTLETFKTAFVEVLTNYGIEVTEDVLDAIVRFSVHYLSDNLQDDDQDEYLAWIGSTLSTMVILFLISQQGGVHRGY